jgi:hypothetical protein
MCIQCSNSEQDLSIWRINNLVESMPNVGHIWRLAKHLAWLFCQIWLFIWLFTHTWLFIWHFRKRCSRFGIFYFCQIAVRGGSITREEIFLHIFSTFIPFKLKLYFTEIVQLKKPYKKI